MSTTNHNGVIAGEKLRPAVPQNPASLVMRVIEPEELAPRRHEKHFPPEGARRIAEAAGAAGARPACGRLDGLKKMAASPDPPQVRLQKLYSLVGSDSVLLPIPFGKKHPDFEKWQKVNFAQSSSAAYEEELLKCFERGGNLGVLLGPASGDLVTIDIDRDDHLASFLGLNPALRETLRSRAKRGCQLWLRMADEYPEVVYRLKSADGLKAGEWRGGGDKGAQSVIYGRHPEKNGKGQPIDYKIVVAKPPILVMFGDIVWPQWLARPLPWEKPPTPPPPPSDKKERASEDNLDKRIRAYLATIPPAESGNGGHDQTFKVANLLIHGWALSIDKARPYLRGYSALCKPPWSEKELEHKLSEAAKATPVKPRGSLRDAVAPSAAAVGQTTRPNVTHATPPPVTDSRGQSPAAPQPADPLEKIVAALEFYYDSERSRFLVKNDVRDWMAVNAGDVRRRLKGAGYSPYKQPGEKLSQVDKLLNAIQHYGHVEYAGNLAGFQKGPYTIGEKRILVLESPRLIEPEGGDYSTLSSVLTKMWGQTQLIYLFGWLKAAIESLRARSWRPGQALVLCGPRDCGKSLCQELFTLLLGGRSAKPHRYMSQQTPFNGDLVGAEHLMIEDEEASSDIRARRFFGARIDVLQLAGAE
jgi:hypothetical protein